MDKDFNDKVNISKNDLLSYDKEDIKSLSKMMNINTTEKSNDIICKEIASKIIYNNTPSLRFDKCERYTKQLTDSQLGKIRSQIYEKFEKYKNTIEQMTITELRKIFECYDNYCFNGDIQKYILDKKYILEFKTSGEETFTTEGICMTTCNYTITIPIHFFTRVNGIVNVAGHLCNDQLECLLRVIEHELVHLIIFMLCDDHFITEQHDTLFMKTAHDLFRHTDYRHYMF